MSHFTIWIDRNLLDAYDRPLPNNIEMQNKEPNDPTRELKHLIEKLTEAKKNSRYFPKIDP